jgi:O-antigen/teichoic acid export membrane protein
MIGFGAGQVLRLASNLILTRLLLPEHFGLSALVAVYCQGLNMLSDVGISVSVVRSKEGDDLDYLNTAWTMSVVRGAILYVIALALSWPAAIAFGEDQLGPLLAVGSAGILISGFASTSILTLRRRLESKTPMYIDLVGQVIGLVTIGVAAYLTRSVWALIAGTHVTAIFRTLVTHYYIRVGYRNRFQWSKEAARSITNFGKWIFLSSAFQFVAQQADRVFLGKMAGLTSLGIYSVAAVLSELGGHIVIRLTHQVLYPVLARVHRESPDRLADAYYKARLALDASVQSVAGLGCALAPVVISVLYDDRYADAGWMLRVLMVRTAIAGILTPCESCLFAVGYSRFGFIRSLLRVATVVIGLPLAMHFWGIFGVVWITALGDLPGALVMLYYFKKHGYLRPLRELIGPAFFALGLLVGWPIAVVLADLV